MNPIISLPSKSIIVIGLLIANKYGHWVDLKGYSGLLKDLAKSDFKVQVTFNKGYTSFGEKLIAGNHEMIVHAEEQGELINKIGIGYDAKTLQNEYTELVNSNKQHREAFNGRNVKYEKSNDEIESAINIDAKYSKCVMSDHPTDKDIRKDYGTTGIGGAKEAANRTGRHTPLQSFQTERSNEKSDFNRKAEKVYEKP